MGLLEKSMDAMYKKRESQFREAERMARDTGATLNDKYYDEKERFERSRSHYEDLKRERSGY